MKLIYITSKNEEAEIIAEELLKEKLIACANIFPAKSKFWWNEKIENSNESIIIAKTRDFHVEDIIDKVKELSSYECPCIMAIDIKKGNQEFFDWIENETS